MNRALALCLGLVLALAVAGTMLVRYGIIPG